jgi:DNA-binding beta-propeller fold protein YncE
MTPPPAPFWPKRASPAPVRVLMRAPTDGLRRYEYVFPDGWMVVYDLDRAFRVVGRVRIPAAGSLHGLAVSPRTATLYLSTGGNGGSSGTGSLIDYDLLRNRIRWERSFTTGADSPSLTPDGRTIFLPTGELTPDGTWYVIDAATGHVRGEIDAGLGPHNTIVDPTGRRVYLGPRDSRYLAVASVRTGRVLRRIGPLRGGVRPFTIDGAQTRAFTTATGFLGFQVSSIRTGRVLYTVPIHGARRGRRFGTPSHGISLSPDSRELYVIDVPNDRVHVYDVRRAPREVAVVRVHTLVGREHPCGGGCGRAGWLQHSLDGRYVFVGDAGDVIDTRRRTVVAFLPALHNSRYQLELDWHDGKPVRTSTRSGIGYANR